MTSNFLKFEKLTIESHATIDRSDTLNESNTFVAMFNPESYSLAYQNVYDQKQGINTSGSAARYSMTKPERLSIKLILDGNGLTNTGVLNFGTPPQKDIYKEVQFFLGLTNQMDGKIHEPKYLTLKWGDLHFNCRLTSVNISYTQFSQSGTPLRAELDTEFIGDLKLSERLKKERKSSPDLTHYRVVNSHDQLPLMCKKIYGSSSFYIMVAKANNLNNFRDLQPGQSLYFPPIAT